MAVAISVEVGVIDKSTAGVAVQVTVVLGVLAKMGGVVGVAVSVGFCTGSPTMTMGR